jgi:aryl carrier-like protein
MDAIVMLNEHDGARRLVAYVKANSTAADTTVRPQELLATLRGELPTHMIPSEIILVDALPLTPNGKIDTARLVARTATARVGPAPAATTLERGLAEIFKRVLRVDAIHPTSNFFDLGATSLKLLEAHEEIRRVHGKLDVVALFEHPNLRDLAEFLSGNAKGSVSAPRVDRSHEAATRLRSLKRPK